MPTSSSHAVCAGQHNRISAICEQQRRLPCWFFANALVRTHLNGRLLLPAIERIVMDVVQARFNGGDVSVLSPELRVFLSLHAFARDPDHAGPVAAKESTLAAFERLAVLSRRL